MQSKLFFTVVVVFCAWIGGTHGEGEWNYDSMGPDVWQDIFPQCGGLSQSPIDFQTACTVYQPFAPFSLSANYDLSQDFFLINNGHALVASLINQTAYPLTMTGGGLNGTFQFVNFHLHWGDNYGTGSEHQVNGQKYAAELHIVHANVETGQLAVLGMFIDSRNTMSSNHSDPHRRRKRELRQRRETNSTAWSEYFSVAGTLNNTDDNSTVSLKLSSLMGAQMTDFWRYSGSLTVPNCMEGVIWTVFTTPMVLDDTYLEVLRQHVMPHTTRGPQPLNNRVVYRNYVNNTPVSASESLCCSNPETPSNRSSTGVVSSFLNHFSLLFFLFVFLFTRE